MKRIKIVQIGIGHDHAFGIALNLKKQSDIFDFAGYVIPETERKECFTQHLVHYEGVPELTLDEAFAIPDLDAVCIETEELSSLKYAIMAAERGLHIHLDKPGSDSHGDFIRLVKIMREKNLVLHMGYMYRYNPMVLRVLDKIQQGELGEIYSIEAHMNCHHLPEKRQWLSQFPGGMMFFLGCHLLDLIVRIQGKPHEVIPYNACIGTDGVTAEDYGMAVLRYEKGVSFAKSCAAEPGGYQRRQLVVCGSKGTIEVKPLEYPTDEGTCSKAAEVYVKDIEDITHWKDYRNYHESEPYSRYDAMMEGFASYVRGEQKNPYSYDYELMLHQVVLQACGKK